MSLRLRLFLVTLILPAMFVINGCGSKASQSSTDSTDSTATSIAFSANSNAIVAGEFVTLTWDVKNATSITISPNLNEADDGTQLPMSGTRTLVLQTTTTYTLMAIAPSGNTSKQVTVTVQNAFPTVKLEADPAIVVSGGTSALRWSTTGTTDLSLSNGIGKVTPGVGTVNVSPTATTTYTATAIGPAGTAIATATVTVASATELVITISASRTAIAKGEKSVLTWQSQNATTVTISPGTGAVNTSGTLEVDPTATTTYAATATSATGEIKIASVTITVLGGAAGLQNIKHVIFFIQENRSFDNYFGMLGAYRKSKGLTDEVDGLDVTRQLKTYSGRTVTPFHQRTVETDVMTPSWNESHFYLNRTSTGEFKMDNWMMQERCSIWVATDPDCTRTMGYYDQRDIPYYYEVASQFATSDRFFSSALSGTVVNRSFLLAATAGGMNNPSDPFPAHAATIFRSLSQAGISWRYYYQDDSVFLGYYSCDGACDWDNYKGNVFPISNYYEVLARPTAEQDLPQVVFIEHAAKLRLDEHTGNNIQLGVADAAKILNALLASKAWPTSVFFLSHDEGGGMYDHVPPYAVSNPDGIAPRLDSSDIGEWDNFTYSGYRLPLLVVSPWVKPHYVSHTKREFTSILKFIETRFTLPPLTKRDAEADDMMEFFDFSTPAWLTPPPLPDQPTNGVVDRSLQDYPN